jgi:hypothetical protein
MSAYGSEWYAGYDAATRDYAEAIAEAERRDWQTPALLLFMWLLGVVAGYAMAVAR